MSKWRTAQAVFLAPFVVPFVLMLPLPDRGDFGHFSFEGLLGGFFIYVLFSLPIAYAAELLLGWPVWMLFKHCRVRSVFAFATAGTLLGLLVYLVIVVFVASPAPDPWTSLFESLSSPWPYLCVIAGTTATLVCRVVVFSGAQTESSR